MILMLNCSYKKSSNTEYFLSLLMHEIQNTSLKNNNQQVTDRECKIICIKDILMNMEKGSLEKFFSELKQAKAFVIGTPLYVDGLPAQIVKLMEVLLEKYKGKIPKLPVYVVSNLGFYEAEQIRHLLAMVENWCKRMGFAYGGGLAVGAGPMVRAVEGMPVKNVLLKDVIRGIEKLAYAITCHKKLKNYCTKTRIPREIYLKAAHMNFDKTAKENGLKVSEVR